MRRSLALCLGTIAGLLAGFGWLAPAMSLDGLSLGNEQPSDTPYILDARVVGDAQRIRFVADMSKTVDAAVFALADPYRIIVDLPEVDFVLPETAGGTSRAFVSAFRYGAIAAGKSRIVIDVSEPVAIERYFKVEPADGQPARLVVDIVPTTREKFLAAAAQYRKDHPVEEVADGGSAIVGGDKDKPLIVLDPGHGGIDLGAKGPGGTLEKNVVLSFSQILGEKLVATGRYRVQFTRSDDTFIALSDRAAIAQKQKAKLFVSVHANSFSGSGIRGAIVYTASDEASDQMAADLAVAENQSDVLAGIDVDAADSDQVASILVDLTRRETRNFGVVFAQNLVKELSKTTRMFKIPRQEANFVVLRAYDVPSALIELGYLTNPADENLLGSAEWQGKTADSIVSAIDAYFGLATAANP